MAVCPEKNRSVAVPYVTRREGMPGLRHIIPSGGANAHRPWQSWRRAKSIRSQMNGRNVGPKIAEPSKNTPSRSITAELTIRRASDTPGHARR
jgi:hypothetical protein